MCITCLCEREYACRYVIVCIWISQGDSGFVLFLSETGFLCVALAVLELVLLMRLTTQRSACFPSAGIRGMYHHAQL